MILFALFSNHFQSVLHGSSNWRKENRISLIGVQERMLITWDCNFRQYHFRFNLETYFLAWYLNVLKHVFSLGFVPDSEFSFTRKAIFPSPPDTTRDRHRPPPPQIVTITTTDPLVLALVSSRGQTLSHLLQKYFTNETKVTKRLIP